MFPVSLGQFTKSYTQTEKRAADDKRWYVPGEGSIPPILLSGVYLPDKWEYISAS